MSWKQIYICIVAGAFFGSFCAVGYMGNSSHQRELAGVESCQKDQALAQGDMQIAIPIEEEEPASESIPVSTAEKPITDQKSDHPELDDQKLNQENSSHRAKELPEIKDSPSIPLRHGNKGLDNYNIMFFGIEDGKLQMLTVYSINEKNNWKSGTVFIPTDTLVPGTGDQYMADYFYRNGPEKVKQLVEKAMEIEISYYVKVDRNLLLEVESYIDPIYVDGEKINLAQLFTKEITPQDEIILASLLKNLTKPSVYFGVLPKLVLTCKQYITTDFELNWPNLWVHYQIAKNIDTTGVTKKIISGKYLMVKNQKYWIPTQEAWWNMVYEVTK